MSYLHCWYRSLLIRRCQMRREIDRERGRERDGDREKIRWKGVGQQVFFCLYICVWYTVTSSSCSSKQSFVCLVVSFADCSFLVVRQIFFSTNHVRQSSTSRFLFCSPFNFGFIDKKDEEEERKKETVDPHDFILWGFFSLSLLMDQRETEKKRRKEWAWFTCQQRLMTIFNLLCEGGIAGEWT